MNYSENFLEAFNGEVKWSEVKWSEVKWSEVKWSEVKEYSIWELITKISRKNKIWENIEIYSISAKWKIIKSADTWIYKKINKNFHDYNIIEKWEFWYNWMHLNDWAIWLMNDEKWLISSVYTMFKLNNNIILNEYFNYLLRTNYIKNKINLLCIQSWWYKFRFEFSNWNKIKIKIPSIERQQQLINYLNTMYTLKNELIKNWNLMDKQINYYLNKLMSLENLNEKDIYIYIS